MLRRMGLIAAAITFAFVGMVNAPVEAHASVPDAAKWQSCTREPAAHGKVRYTVYPRASFEVEELHIAGRTAKMEYPGVFSKVMKSQEFAGKHWVYLDVFGEAQGFSTWARCKPINL